MRRLPSDDSGGNAAGFPLSAGALADALAPLEFGRYHASWRDLRAALAERTGDTLYVRWWGLWG